MKLALKVAGVNVHLAVAPGLREAEIIVRPPAWRFRAGTRAARSVADGITGRFRSRTHTRTAPPSWRNLSVTVEARFAQIPGPRTVAALVEGIVTGLQAPGANPTPTPDTEARRRKETTGLRNPEHTTSPRYIWAANPLGSGEVLNRTRPVCPELERIPRPSPMAPTAPPVVIQPPPAPAPGGAQPSPSQRLPVYTPTERTGQIGLKVRTVTSHPSVPTAIHRFTVLPAPPAAGAQPVRRAPR